LDTQNHVVGGQRKTVANDDELFLADGHVQVSTTAQLGELITVSHSHTQSRTATQLDPSACDHLSIYEIMCGAKIKQSNKVCVIDGDKKLHCSPRMWLNASEGMDGYGGFT
jgi:hypothetical protein